MKLRLVSTINFMTKGFDDQILSYLQNKCGNTKLKKHDDNYVKYESLLILKICFSILFGYGVKIAPDINPIYG